MTRALVFGALLGLLLVVFGVPLPPCSRSGGGYVPSTVLAALLQPLPIAFALGVLAGLRQPRRRTA